MHIVFAPSDLGGGMGHLSRCLALADSAVKRGHTVSFILEKPDFIHRVRAEYRVEAVNQQAGEGKDYRLSEKIRGLLFKPPAFIRISGLSYQVLRDGLHSADIVRSKIKRYVELLDDLQPDLAVGDTNLIIGSAAKLTGVPCVQLVRKGFHPQDPRLIWWEDTGLPIEAPPVVPMLNEALDTFSLPQIETSEQLLTGNMYLIPSLPELEPVNELDKTFYIGPLIRRREMPVNSTLKNPVDRPRIYMTIGGGAGTVGNQRFFRTIQKAFADTNVQVEVSTTKRFWSDKLKKAPQNIHFAPWVDGWQTINQSDLVVFHGGYGTMMETVVAGVPSIVIPFHSEQESNGRRLQEQGCAVVLPCSQDPEKVCKHDWQGSVYSYAFRQRFHISPQVLAETCHNLLKTESYQAASLALQKNAETFNAQQLFFDLIANSLGVT